MTKFTILIAPFLSLQLLVLECLPPFCVCIWIFVKFLPLLPFSFCSKNDSWRRHTYVHPLRAPTRQHKSWGSRDALQAQSWRSRVSNCPLIQILKTCCPPVCMHSCKVDTMKNANPLAAWSGWIWISAFQVSFVITAGRRQSAPFKFCLVCNVGGLIFFPLCCIVDEAH